METSLENSIDAPRQNHGGLPLPPVPLLVLFGDGLAMCFQ